jgi:hypothetical protein|tara:strand:+ start:180 stop:290 length:111 start_codon:yes stop_codon:yes gene_type:complete
VTQHFEQKPLLFADMDQGFSYYNVGLAGAGEVLKPF